MTSAGTPRSRQARANVAAADGTRFLSPRQLAERWSCTTTTAQRIARNAGMAKYCLGEGRNGMVRYLLSEVEAYEAERRVTGIT